MKLFYFQTSSCKPWMPLGHFMLLVSTSPHDVHFLMPRVSFIWSPNRMQLHVHDDMQTCVLLHEMSLKTFFFLFLSTFTIPYWHGRFGSIKRMAHFVCRVQVHLHAQKPKPTNFPLFKKIYIMVFQSISSLTRH